MRIITTLICHAAFSVVIGLIVNQTFLELQFTEKQSSQLAILLGVGLYFTTVWIVVFFAVAIEHLDTIQKLIDKPQENSFLTLRQK